MQNYADVLESYLIPAEEGFGNFLKGMKDKILKFIKWLIDKCKELGQKIANRLRKKSHSNDSNSPVSRDTKSADREDDAVTTTEEPESKRASSEEMKKVRTLASASDCINQGLRILRKDYMSHVLENIKTCRTNEEVATEGMERIRIGIDKLRTVDDSTCALSKYLVDEDLNEILDLMSDVSDLVTSLLKQLQQMVETTPETDENKELLRVINSHLNQVSKILSLMNEVYTVV